MSKTESHAVLVVLGQSTHGCEFSFPCEFGISFCILLSIRTDFIIFHSSVEPNGEELSDIVASVWQLRCPSIILDPVCCGTLFKGCVIFIFIGTSN